jgi:hypothetical protein
LTGLEPFRLLEGLSLWETWEDDITYAVLSKKLIHKFVHKRQVVAAYTKSQSQVEDVSCDSLIDKRRSLR